MRMYNRFLNSFTIRISNSTVQIRNKATVIFPTISQVMPKL